MTTKVYKSHHANHHVNVCLHTVNKKNYPQSVCGKLCGKLFTECGKVVYYL